MLICNLHHSEALLSLLLCTTVTFPRPPSSWIKVPTGTTWCIAPTAIRWRPGKIQKSIFRPASRQHPLAVANIASFCNRASPSPLATRRPFVHLCRCSCHSRDYSFLPCYLWSTYLPVLSNCTTPFYRPAVLNLHTLDSYPRWNTALWYYFSRLILSTLVLWLSRSGLELKLLHRGLWFWDGDVDRFLYRQYKNDMKMSGATR